MYELEDELFRALGRRRDRELQLDVLAFFLLAILIAGFYLLGNFVSRFPGFPAAFEWRWWAHPLTFAAFLAVVGGLVAVESARREWGWRR